VKARFPTPPLPATLLLCLLAAVALAATEADERIRDLKSPLPAVRRSAAAWLGRAGAREAVPALVAALKDPDAAVRSEAAKALGFIKDARAADALAAALRDPDRNVRFCAAYALGELREPSTAQALLAALDDPEPTVREQAAWALRELHDPALAKPLAERLARGGPAAPHAAWALRQMGIEHIVPAVARLLGHRDPGVRLRAVELLAGAADKAATAPLLEALADADAKVRLAAVRALVQRREPKVLAAVRELAKREKDPAVRQAAAEAALLLARHPKLAAHWSFDDGDTALARDAAGSGTNGRIIGCKPVQGKVGKALLFADGGYVELGKPDGLPIAHQPFTVMAWVKTAAANGVVVARGGAFCGYSLYIKDGLPAFGIHRVKDGPAYIARGREKIGAGWAHLAGVVKADRVELYVNGRLAATAKTPGYIPSNCGQGMEIGFDTGNSPAEITDAFEGVIDEVKVFNAALSPGEIAKELRPAQQK